MPLTCHAQRVQSRAARLPPLTRPRRQGQWTPANAPRSAIQADQFILVDHLAGGNLFIHRLLLLTPYAPRLHQNQPVIQDLMVAMSAALPSHR